MTKDLKNQYKRQQEANKQKSTYITNSIKCVFCGECFVKAMYLVWNE